jgi:N utilization substance protein B
MKNPLDPRHKKRQKAVEDLFRNDFHKQRIGKIARKVISKKEIIDAFIVKSAPEFPIDKINKIDLAILRMAVFELEVEHKEPPKVIIDEAIELAKEYGGETSPSFINGALGKLIKNDTTKI